MKKLKLTIAIVCFGLIGFTANAQDEDKVNQANDLFNKSVALFGENNFDEAIKQANEALQLVANGPEGSAEIKANLEKTIPKIYYEKASDQLKKQDFVGALKTLEETTVLATKYNAPEIVNLAKELMPQVYKDRAGSDFNEKNYDQAIECTQKAIEAGSRDSKVYLIQAMSYLQKNDVAKAQELLIKTAEVAKATGNKADEATANEYLSNMFLKEAIAAQKTKKWGEVLKNANKSLTYKESNNGYKLKGAASTALKKWDDVIVAYTALLSDAKEAGGANYNLGMAYLGKGNTAKACEHFRKVGNDPNYKVPAEQQLKIIKCS